MFKNGLAYVILFTTAVTYYLLSAYLPWWAAAGLSLLMFIGMVEAGAGDAPADDY